MWLRERKHEYHNESIDKNLQLEIERVLKPWNFVWDKYSLDIIRLD